MNKIQSKTGNGRCATLLAGCLSAALYTFPAMAADANDPPNMAPVGEYMMARTDEIALAKTAAVASISDHAEVLVLGAQGYESAVKGTNGFVCLVQRPWAGDFDAPEFWNPKLRGPECWNAAAASSMLPEYLKRTEWVMAGVSRDEMAARTKTAVAAHEMGQPAPGSMVYMLSKQQSISSAQGKWYPHIMFLVPATDGSPWGANTAGSLVYAQTFDFEPVSTYFILAPRWSDGTLGPYAAMPEEEEHHHHG